VAVVRFHNGPVVYITHVYMARVAEEVKIFGAVFGYAPVIAP
jgi:hypothetical protein